MFGQVCSQHPRWFWGGMGKYISQIANFRHTNGHKLPRMGWNNLVWGQAFWKGRAFFNPRNDKAIFWNVAVSWATLSSHPTIRTCFLAYTPSYRIYSDVWVHKHWLPNYLAPRRTLSSRYTRESQFSKWVCLKMGPPWKNMHFWRLINQGISGHPSIKQTQIIIV